MPLVACRALYVENNPREQPVKLETFFQAATPLRPASCHFLFFSMQLPPLSHALLTPFLLLRRLALGKSGRPLANKTSDDNPTPPAALTADHRQRPATCKLRHVHGLAACAWVEFCII